MDYEFDERFDDGHDPQWDDEFCDRYKEICAIEVTHRNLVHEVLMITAQLALFPGARDNVLVRSRAAIEMACNQANNIDIVIQEFGSVGMLPPAQNEGLVVMRDQALEYERLLTKALEV